MQFNDFKIHVKMNSDIKTNLEINAKSCKSFLNLV